HYNLRGHKIAPFEVHFELPKNLTHVSPTCMVANYTRGFVVSRQSPLQGELRAASLFLISTDEGYLYGYNPLVCTDEALIVSAAAAPHERQYTGLAIAGRNLFVANRQSKKIDVYDFNFTRIDGFPFV